MKTETMITGVRPTGDLTIANYLGAVQPLLENLILIATLLTEKGASDRESIATLLSQHDRGEKVMGEFKKLLIEILISFVSGFQKRRQSYSDLQVKKILEVGSEKAKENARNMILKMEAAMGFNY